MADQDHFAAFAARRTGGLAALLLDEFRRAFHSADVPRADYAQRLRHTMEAHFAEAANGPARRAVDS